MSPRLSRRVHPLSRTLIREIFESAPQDALNLGLGQPDLSAPQILREALARAAMTGPSGYGPTAGLVSLREAIAASYPDFARDAGDVMVTAGCQQAGFVSLGCLLDPGDEVLIPDPGFPGAGRAALAWSASARSYPLHPENGFHLDPEDVMSLVTPRTRAILVISPSNPTGTVESAETLATLARESAARGLTLILDDTYRSLHWLSDGPAPTLPGLDNDHVVICGGLSKSVALTGWRVGWAITRDPRFMEKLVALQQTVLTCPSTPIQLGAELAFSREGQHAAEGIRRRFLARRNLVERLLPTGETERAPLEGAFYAWVRPRGNAGGRAFAKRLLRDDRIVLIPGEAFGEAYPDWVRISYAQEDKKLEEALETIAERLDER